jgi:hypothetical protein
MTRVSVGPRRGWGPTRTSRIDVTVDAHNSTLTRPSDELVRAIRAATAT